MEFIPKWIAWETTQKCNLKCVHCRCSSDMTSSEGDFTTEEGKKLLKEIADYSKPVVVLSGGILLGAGLVAASRAATLGQFRLLFGVIVGVAAGSFYAPMTAATARWFVEHRSLAVALVSAGLGLGSMTVAPLAFANCTWSWPVTPSPMTTTDSPAKRFTWRCACRHVVST